MFYILKIFNYCLKGDGRCGSNQEFYTIEETNEGICDCIRWDKGLVFHRKSGSCYHLNTQV